MRQQSPPRNVSFGMKALMFILLFGGGMARAQCGYDSIGGGGAGIAASDTATVGGVAPRCTNCDADSCVAWQLPAVDGDTTSMFIYLYNPDSAMFSVQITMDCDLLLWDTCGVLSPRTPVNDPFVVMFTFYGNAQIVVCGAMGDSVILEVKITPQRHRILDTPILDLATCSMPVGVAPQEAATKCLWSVDFMTGRVARAHPPLAPGIYFETDGETFSGRGRKIMAR
jgi:hypothetical protein